MKFSNLLGVCAVAMLPLTAPVMAADKAMSSKMPVCDTWTGCDLTMLAKDATVGKMVKFESDPVGLAAQPASDGADVMKALTQYAMHNKCNLYVLSMNDLMGGLLKSSGVASAKGFDFNMPKAKIPEGHGITVSNISKNPMKDIDLTKGMGKINKYLLVGADKAMCAKKLGLEVPLKTIHGKKGDAK